MFQRRTVIVVGAGASKELGFPVGSELKYQISALLSPKQRKIGRIVMDQRLEEAFEKLGGGVQRWIKAAEQVAKAMPVAESIDNFLHTHSESPDIEKCGKIAISACILNAESESPLFASIGQRPDLGHDSLKDCWLNRFCNRLFVDTSPKGLAEIFEKITFVIFNYDRCVETYLLEAISRYYLVSRTKAAEILEHATFYHPYGTVGRLPWQGGEEAWAGFGADISGEGLVELAAGIRTFTESKAEDERLLDIRERYLAATRIIYLGFSFAAQNMKLLGSGAPVEGQALAQRQVYATAFGVSDADCKVFRTMIAKSFKENPASLTNMEKIRCFELFDAYSRSIAD